MEQATIKTPQPPYYTVVFSAQMSERTDGYEDMAMRMVELASGQPGFLGIETAQNPNGSSITVSYWVDEESIRNWKKNVEHQEAQRTGRAEFYQNYTVRVGRIDRDYGFDASA